MGTLRTDFRSHGFRRNLCFSPELWTSENNPQTRNGLAWACAGLLAVLALAPVVDAQATLSRADLAKQHCGQSGQPGTVYQQLCSDAKPSAPAPKRDITGSWSGPILALHADPMPPMTPWAEARFSENGGGKGSNFDSNVAVAVAASKDPLNHCDPLGFPRDTNFQLRGLAIGQMPNRMLIMSQYERIWREVWTDGRALPKNAGSDDPNAPDPRYYGYSVGHWEGDYTFVVDTTGVDDATWIDGTGHPHSTDMHGEERYTRIDHNTLQVSVQIDDPKAYTKPWMFGKTVYKWIPDQEFEEQLCIPSSMELYLKNIANPAGEQKK